MEEFHPHVKEGLIVESNIINYYNGCLIEDSREKLKLPRNQFISTNAIQNHKSTYPQMLYNELWPLTETVDGYLESIASNLESLNLIVDSLITQNEERDSERIAFQDALTKNQLLTAVNAQNSENEEHQLLGGLSHPRNSRRRKNRRR